MKILMHANKILEYVIITESENSASRQTLEARHVGQTSV